MGLVLGCVFDSAVGWIVCVFFLFEWLCVDGVLGRLRLEKSLAGCCLCYVVHIHIRFVYRMCFV